MTTDLKFGQTCIPPQDTETEERILGGILMSPVALEKVIDVLKPEAFYINIHKDIYRAAVVLYRKGYPVDFETVLTWLSDEGKLASIGGRQKLIDLVSMGVNFVNIDLAAVRVMEKYHRREAIALANEFSGGCYDTTQILDELLGEIQSRIYDLQRQRQEFENATKKADDIAISVYQELQDNNCGEEASYPFLPTSFYALDALAGGLPVGATSILAGRPKMGKTSFALELAIQCALQDAPALYFSLEMSKEQLVRKALSRLSAPERASEQGIRAEQLFRRNAIGASDWEAVNRSMAKLSGLPLWINDASCPTVTDIRAEAQKLKRTEGLALVVIDYVGLMRLEKGRSANRVTELDFILGDLRAISKDLKIAVLGLAQINRGVDGRNDKRPTMGDIRESGAYEQEAAVMIGLYNDAAYNPDSPDKGIIEAIVMANRFGSTGTARLLFEPQYGRFRNLAETEYDF